jgi:membrane protease YdiL (CAAX protease family)
MTLLVWLAWRLLQKGQGTPKSICYVVAILLSALVFGIGHLPVTYMLFSEPTVSLILFVVIANSTFGLVAGYLYWKKGLESAIIAHVFGHIVLAVASYAGAYF